MLRSNLANEPLDCLRAAAMLLVSRRVGYYLIYVSTLQSLDIYEHATQGETMCYAMMEPQGCGLPVVGSDVRGVRAAIEEGSTGLLFPHKDVHALAQLLLRLSNALTSGNASDKPLERTW